MAPATVSGQKKMEKKIKIVTIDDNGKKTVIDTTYVIADTLSGEFNEFVFRTEDGKIIRGRTGGRHMIFAGEDQDLLMLPAPHGMKQGDQLRMIAPLAEKEDGVTYHISVDGVTVNIRAPKEKAGEADQILAEVKKILMKK